MRHDSAILSRCWAAVNAQTASVQHVANSICIDERRPAADQILAIGVLSDHLNRLHQVLGSLKSTLGLPALTDALNH